MKRACELEVDAGSKPLAEFCPSAESVLNHVMNPARGLLYGLVGGCCLWAVLLSVARLLLHHR